MRIIVAIENEHWGAAESYALWLCDGLQRRGHEAILLALPDSGAQVPQIIKSGLPLSPLPKSPLASFRGARATIRKFKPHVVHVNFHVSPVLIASLMERTKVRAVTDHMLPLRPRYNLRGSLIASGTRRAANTLVVFSKQNAEAAKAQWPKLEPALIYPGVPLPSCSETREATRQALGLSDQIIVSTVGRLSPEKRHDVFIRAIGHVRDRIDRVHGLIVGEGSTRPELEGLIEQLGLQGAVTLAGHREDVACLLKASDLYVHCPEREGLGFAVLEAMAAGLPIIVSRVPALIEVIEGCSAPLVEVGDHLELGRRVVELLEKQGFAGLGQALQERWRVSFTLDRMVSDHELLYIRSAERKDRIR